MSGGCCSCSSRGQPVAIVNNEMRRTRTKAKTAMERFAHGVDMPGFGICCEWQERLEEVQSHPRKQLRKSNRGTHCVVPTPPPNLHEYSLAEQSCGVAGGSSREGQHLHTVSFSKLFHRMSPTDWPSSTLPCRVPNPDPTRLTRLSPACTIIINPQPSSELLIRISNRPRFLSVSEPCASVVGRRRESGLPSAKIRGPAWDTSSPSPSPSPSPPRSFPKLGWPVQGDNPVSPEA